MELVGRAHTCELTLSSLEEEPEDSHSLNYATAPKQVMQLGDFKSLSGACQDSLTDLELLSLALLSLLQEQQSH